MSKKIFLKGTLILACTGLISRIAGFFYRIFLSHAIGAEGLGLYQLVLPLQGLMAALSYTGIQSALSRLIASRLALQEKKEARFSLVTGTLMAVFFSAAAGFLLFQHAYFFCFRNSENTADCRSSSHNSCQYSSLCHSFLH